MEASWRILLTLKTQSSEKIKLLTQKQAARLELEQRSFLNNKEKKTEKKIRGKSWMPA